MERLLPGKTNKIRRLALIIAVNILISIVLIAVVEITARLSGFGPPTPPHWENQFGKHKKLGYTAVPYSRWSYVGTSEGVLKTYIGTANKDGFRPTIWNKNCEHCPAILTIGDSTTFSAEVNDNETWPEFTAKTLNKSGHAYKLVNYGMRGYSTVQSYVAMREAFKNVNNIRAVIYMFTMNDPHENYPLNQDQILARPRPYVIMAEDNRFKIRDPVIIQDWELAFEKNSSQGGILRNIIRYNFAVISVYDYFVKGIDHKKPSKNFDLSDDGYLLQWDRGQAIENIEMLRNTLTNQYYLPILAGLLFEMNKECSDRGVKFFVACLPSFIRPGNSGEQFIRLIQMSAVQYGDWIQLIDKLYNIVQTMTIKAGGNFLDLNRDVLAGMSFKEYASSPSDWHYSPSANKLIGDEISKKLIQQWLGDRQ